MTVIAGEDVSVRFRSPTALSWFDSSLSSISLGSNVLSISKSMSLPCARLVPSVDPYGTTVVEVDVQIPRDCPSMKYLLHPRREGAVHMPSFSFSAAVNSSTIKGLSYSEDAKALAVVFHSGLSYMYTGVPKEIAIGLLGAESVGNFHSTRVKGYYPYLKVGLQDQAEIRQSESHRMSALEVAITSGTALDQLDEVTKHPRKRAKR
jgi:hypothetical protein